MRHAARAEYVREAERAATRLGLPSHGPAADVAIVDYCRREISRLTAEHGLPPDMGELLVRVASCLDVEFVEIHSDEDLAQLVRRITLEAEPALALLATELDDDTDAVTIRRSAPSPWERRYLAVINCRGQHYHRRFFTKWHELAHRLLEGEQLALAFRRTARGAQRARGDTRRQDRGRDRLLPGYRWSPRTGVPQRLWAHVQIHRCPTRIGSTRGQPPSDGHRAAAPCRPSRLVPPLRREPEAIGASWGT